MAAPLSKRQRMYLAQLARAAFLRAVANGKWQMADGTEVPAGSITEKMFRHEETIKAVGRRGLRCCSQDNYGYVESHFRGVLGQEGRAVKAAVRQASNDLRVVQWKILHRCEEYGIPLAKAEGICRQMTRGKGLQEVEETHTLWNVFFKLRFYESKEAA